MVNIAGHKINKWYLIGGGVAVVGVWFIYKRGATGTSGSSDPNATDPVTGLPYSQDNQIDPITGLSYLAEAQQYGSVTAAEQEITSGSAFFGQTGVGSALDSGFPTISGISGSGGTVAGGSFATNAAWAQAVTAGLINLGYSAQDVAAALGLYFQSQPLGSGADGVSYASIVQAAVAEFGPPPVGTFPIIPAPSTPGATPPPVPGGGGGGGGGGGTGGPLPPVGGKPPPHVIHLKGVRLSQPHKITQSEAAYLWAHPGNGGVYWKASDGSYVDTHTGQGVGQLYTGPDGWAYLKKHKK